MAPGADRAAEDAGSHPWPRVVYLVSHTHWDREWYRTFQDFRADLIPVVDGVLQQLQTNEEFNHFELDGQSILLEDYLAVRPAGRDRIEQAAAAGQLSLGPWYVLPDEFLVSGEATIRNLWYGHAAAARLGPVNRVGYLPDSFGHIAQLPQLLRGAGLEYFVYARGDGDSLDGTGSQYLWRGPDGSEIPACHLHRGYCAGGALGYPRESDALAGLEPDPGLAVSQVARLLEEMRPLARSDVALIPNGCDHLPAQRGMGPILQALRRAFPACEFKQASYHACLREMFAACQELSVVTGELRGGKRQLLLPGVLSTRMYLKQRNDRAQRLLAGTAEPLACYLQATRSVSPEIGLLDLAWRTLIANHPHDSICGCSIDQVHREMETRFAQVEQIGEALVRGSLAGLSAGSSAGETELVTFNPLPRRRTELVERLVVLGGHHDWEPLEVVDADGTIVPHHVVRRHRVEQFWGHDYRSDPVSLRAAARFGKVLDQLGHRILRPAESSTGGGAEWLATIQFPADLPAMAHHTFRVRRASAEPLRVTPAVTASSDTIENDLVRVTLAPNGTFSITDKKSGRHYPGLNLLESTEDVGDEYDHAPAASSLTVTSRGREGSLAAPEVSPWRASLQTSFEWPLPVGVTTQRRGRRIEEVTCPVKVTLTLDAASPVVDVVTEFDNRASDHRVRACFPTGCHSDTLISQGQFHVARRSVGRSDRPDWVQPPSGTQPQQGWSAVEDAAVQTAGLAVFNQGLPEVAAWRGEGETIIGLTLLRAVGWLSRDDHDARRGAVAGPMVPTPEAQCLGPASYHYAVIPYTGDWRNSGLTGWHERWQVPPVTIQAAGARPGIKHGVADSPAGVDFLELEGDAVLLSALKPHAARGTLIARLWSTAEVAQPVALRLGVPLAAVWRSDLLERRHDSLPVDRDVVAFSLGPWEIATVELELA